ncbi:MAG: hypothetical protein AABY04_02920, partial [Candidatus Micrarchaeota archaeon]
KDLIAGQKEAIKYKYMKREISQEEFSKAFMVLDDRETKADARLNEWIDKQNKANKASGKDDAKGKAVSSAFEKSAAEPEKVTPEGLDSKNQSVISQFKASQLPIKPRPEENKELDALFDELKKKTDAKKQ